MSVPHILFALTADVRINTRARKQIQAFQEAGMQVTVVGLETKAAHHVPLPPFIRWFPLNVAPHKGPAFFLAWHRALSRYLSQLPPADVYHASDLYVLPALAHTARRHQARLVYDARERYPYVAGTAGKLLAQRFWYHLERHYIRQADVVLTVSHSLARALEQDYAIPSPLLLPNVPRYRPISRTDHLRNHLGIPSHMPILLHQGVMKPGRGAPLLLDAMRDIPDAALVFMGHGPLQEVLQHQTHQLNLQDRVYFMPPVPPETLLSWTASADAGISLLEDICYNHHVALPNKVFEYLMAGLPVLVSALPEMKRFVEHYQVGLAVQPANRDALVTALRQLAFDTHVRERLRSRIPEVWKDYSWERYMKRVIDTYRHLLASQSVTSS